jgi:pyruvate formate lyase activating enzyme
LCEKTFTNIAFIFSTEAVMQEAVLYEKLEGNKVRCGLCAHRCVIGNNRRGICGVRENREGTLVSLVYGKIIAEHVDPIEKKPLFHYLPGTKAFSIGTVGCNFHCKHCQNADISQYPQEHEGAIIGHSRTPAQIVDMALTSGCASIAYTYNEPTVFMEFAHDTAKLAAKQGLGNVFVSNGYMTREAAEYIAPLLGAINIDIKGFSESFYKEICKARLDPVLQTVRTMHELGVWVEVTTLIIPGHNDSDEELGQIADFIVSVDPYIPWHVTRFYPAYLMTDVAPTPTTTIKRARSIGRAKGLAYVYEGNIPGQGDENTYCPECGALCVERSGFGVTANKIIEGGCPECKARLHGIFV